MTDNFLQKRKRITHIGTLANASAAGDAGSSCSIDYVNDIIRRMDSNNNCESKIMSNECLPDTTLMNIQKHMLTNMQKDNSSISPSCASNNSNAKFKKFTAPQQAFPLMAKCQKSLKYLQHNRRVPKQRAHVNQLPKSPLKHRKANNHELHKFNKKLNRRHKGSDFQLNKKINESVAEQDNIYSSQFIHQKKIMHKSSRKENNGYPVNSHSLHENFHNVGNNEKEISGNLSSASDGEFENFIKMHAPVSSKNVIKKKQMKSQKSSLKRPGKISRKLSSSESDTESQMHIHSADHTSSSKFHKLRKTDPSSMTDVENNTYSKHRFENKNESGQNELKHKIKAVQKEKNKLCKNVLNKAKGNTIFQKDKIEETVKNCTTEKLNPSKSQQKHPHFKCTENVDVNFPTQNDEILSSSDSSSDSVISRTFECVHSDLSEESSYSPEITRPKRRVKRRQIKSASEESTDSNKQRFLLASSPKELLACSGNSHSSAESVQLNKRNLQCTVLLKRVDNLLTTFKECDLNSKRAMPQLKRNVPNQEHFEADSLTTPGNENQSKQIERLENNINIQIADVCSLATVEDSDDVIFISDSSDSEYDSTDRASVINSKVEKCKENEFECTVSSEQHISKDSVGSAVIESSNSNEVLFKEQNCKIVELSSTSKEQSQNSHNKINPESEADSSDIEIIEIKSVMSGNSNICVSTNNINGVKSPTLVSKSPLRKPSNIPLEHNQLAATSAFNNEFNEQNSSCVSSSIKSHEYVGLEVNKINAATPNMFEGTSKDSRELEKLKNSTKGLYTDASTYFQGDQKNSESDDDCVILHEKKVINASSFRETSVHSVENMSEIAKKTGSNLIADEEMENLNSSQETNSLKRSDSKCNISIEGFESCVKNNQHLDKKNSLTKSEHQDVQIIKSKHVDDKACIVDMSADTFDVKINQSKIEAEDLAPDPHIIEMLTKYFDLKHTNDMKMLSEDVTNSTFSNPHLSCSREFAKNSTGISLPDTKSFRIEHILDDSIIDLEQFLNANDPKRKISGSVAHLYKLYQRELKQYDEIKRTEKNVEIGLKLLEEKQRNRITQIEFILKLFAGKTPCCQTALDMTIKQEKTKDESQEKFSSKKLVSSHLSSHASELNLLNTCTKSDAEIFKSTDRVNSSYNSSAKKTMHSLPSTSEDIAICEKSSKLNVSAGLPIEASLDKSKEHFILKSATSSYIRDNDISTKVSSKEAICYSPTLNDGARKESSDVCVSASPSDESKEQLKNLIMSAGTSSVVTGNDIYSTKITAGEAVCYSPSTLKDTTQKKSHKLIVSASPSVGVASDESKEHLRNLILKSASSLSSTKNCGTSTNYSDTPVDWQFKINPDLNEKQVKELLKEKCSTCRKPGKFACQGCQKICFCSEECGMIFWENGHKDSCSG